MNAETLFWDLIEPMYADPAVSQGTLMGHPCVRVNGDFFAMYGGMNDQMVVKLPAERVTELVESSDGQPVAPAGRVFREWIGFDEPDEASWEALLEEAKEFVAG